MKLRILLLLSLGFWGLQYTHAQATLNPKKYAALITQENLRKNLQVLASDEYEGRETGQKGQRMAAEYIASQFSLYGIKEYGPDKGYYQKIPLIQNVLAERLLEVNQTKYTIGEDFYLQKDFPALELLSNEILFAGYGIKDQRRDDFGSLPVEGKVILVYGGEPTTSKGMSWITLKNEKSEWSKIKYKLNFLKSLKPALILYVDDNIKTNAAAYMQHQKTTLQLDGTTKKEQSPVIYISSTIADNLLKPNKKSTAKFKNVVDKTGLPNKAFVLKSTLKTNIQFISRKVEAENVLGFIEGSDLKDEVLIITAHYDHIGIINGKVYNGADDDGSGTVAVMEMARAFAMAKNNGEGPRRSILFMTVAGEEKGLLGSKYYTENPVFPLDKTIADLNIDMIGRIDEKHANDSNYVYIIGSDKLSTQLHKINENANAQNTRLSLDYTYNNPDDPNRFYYRSDHYNFVKHNIPIIFYFNGVHADYHQEGDEISKINFALLQKRAQLVFYTAWELANRNERIVVDVKNIFPADR